MATTKKRTTTAAKPVTRAKARSTSKGVALTGPKLAGTRPWRRSSASPRSSGPPTSSARCSAKWACRSPSSSGPSPPASSTPGTWTSSTSLGVLDISRNGAQHCRVAPRKAWRRASPRHLNRALNRTVSDSHLSVSPIAGDGESRSSWNGSSSRRCSVAAAWHHGVSVCAPGRGCRRWALPNGVYADRFQADESRKSWLRRWEYGREPPDADYPYSLGHMHVRANVS